MKPITLTAEQAQQIHNALIYADTTCETELQSKRRGDAIAIIRAARLQAYHIVEATNMVNEQELVAYCGASVWVADRKISIVASEDMYTNTLLCELTQQCLAKLSDELRENKN